MASARCRKQGVDLDLSLIVTIGALTPVCTACAKAIAFEQVFYLACFIAAVYTFEDFVGALPEAFRMLGVDHLPVDEHDA